MITKFPKKLLFISLLSVSLASNAAYIELRNPDTNQIDQISADNAQQRELIGKYINSISGYESELFNVYVDKGYRPIDALSLTNLDIYQGLRELDESVPEIAEQKQIRTHIAAQYRTNGEDLFLSIPDNLALRNPDTGNFEPVSHKEVNDAALMRKYVNAVVSSDRFLFDAYIDKGFHPFHALILTNWDIAESVRLTSGNGEQDAAMLKQVEKIRSIYINKPGQ